MNYVMWERKTPFKRDRSIDVTRLMILCRASYQNDMKKNTCVDMQVLTLNMRRSKEVGQVFF